LRQRWLGITGFEYYKNNHTFFLNTHNDSTNLNNDKKRLK
jgi:hypothetical protein